jgi:hypothetical protein
MTPLPPHIAQSKGTPHTHLVFATGFIPVGTAFSVDWRQFNYMLQAAGHEAVVDKMHAKLVTPWTPADGLLTRKASSFGYTTMLVFDLDKINTMDIDQVVEWCKGRAALVHTTFSHGVDGRGCFRIFMLVEQQLSHSAYRSAHGAVLATLPELAKRVDPSCADPSRCYFMPSCPAERKHLAEIRPSFGGPGIDVEALPIGSIGTSMPAQGATLASSASIGSPATGVLPAPATQGNRNTSLCSFLGREFSKGFTPEGVRSHAMAFGSSCIPPMDPAEVETTIQSMWRTHSNNHPQQNTVPPQGTRLLTALDLVILPALQWRVKGLLPAKGMASIYGPSGSGKTFLALDIACAIAAERPQWFGSKVKGAPVAYVALEGTAGLQQRVKAWELHHKQTAPNAIRFVLGGFTLLAPHHATALATEIVGTLGRGAVVVIDTLNQSAPGADENSSVDMGTVISNAKVLADAVDGLVILVHHSGKDQTRGMRGHSSLHAALDSVIEVVNGPSGRSWRVTKSKDGESGVAHGFELVPYVVGQDEDSEDITSCAIRSALTGTNAKRSGPTGKNQIAALQVVSGLARTRGGGISLADAMQAVAAAFQGPPGRRNSRAKEAIESLTESGHLQLADGQISIP